MKTVYFDIDTQLDFVMPAGALYVPGADGIIATVSALNRYAAQSGDRLISTMDAHAEDDPEFKSWPSHCVKGTLGQRKPESTLLVKRIVVSSQATDASIDGTEQILLEKQHLDCFTNPNLSGLLDFFGAKRYVVYGVVTELCVMFAAFGLLKTGKPVEIVADAIRSLNDDNAKSTLEEFKKGGGIVTTAAAVLSST